MMEETLADANRPSDYVEFGGKDAVGIPSPEPIPPGAGGGARSHRVVCSLGPAGQGDRRQHGDHAEKGFPLAQALPGAGRAGGAERRAPAGRKPTIGARLTKRGVTMTTRQQPANATHWSTRTMAAAVGISEASVRRIWRAHGLKPHRVEAFKISNDPAFAEKLEDIVGLYLNPPEHALVLCADEKSQIQALDRTQPSLPLKRGRGATMTHD